MTFRSGTAVENRTTVWLAEGQVRFTVGRAVGGMVE
jgi:hypothetical protein